MAVIRKIKLQKACYQAVTKATTKNSHSNDRFGVNYMLGICWVYVRYMQGICKLYVRYMLDICWIYPEYTRDKRMSALDLWSLATEGRV